MFKKIHLVLKTLIEAQEMAVREHNIEFKSNLWICKSNFNNRDIAYYFNVLFYLLKNQLTLQLKLLVLSKVFVSIWAQGLVWSNIDTAIIMFVQKKVNHLQIITLVPRLMKLGPKNISKDCVIDPFIFLFNKKMHLDAHSLVVIQMFYIVNSK